MERRKRRPTSAERKLARAEARIKELEGTITTTVVCGEFRACSHCLRAISVVFGLEIPPEKKNG